ncbi:SCO3242 family prenyltransferase [Streptomyces sp. NPDC101115]|uniref:SCO3242 family prenyltransferase n=1 Tax=Streptomyces sp. NPDC101115 TaxID=3366106 RepID=UPI003821DAFE
MREDRTIGRATPARGARSAVGAGTGARGSGESTPRGARGFRPRWDGRAGAWAELLRVSALATVPGDALAGAAALGARPHRGTLLALGSSLCLYEAGMALNDWADRAEDARDRPHRPLPSGRIRPRAALAASTALTATGLALAARAGRAPLAVAGALAATVWAYDLHLKHTRLGPATMAGARALDLLLGATATATSARHTGPATRGAGLTARRRGDTPVPGPVAWRRAATSAGLLGAHTYAVTMLSRHETQGGATAAPVLALAVTAGLAAAAGGGGGSPLAAVLAADYARTPATPLLHAVLNPSPPLTQRAVGGGIRALVPLQATLAARSGAPGTALALLALAPLARALARKVSPT